MRFNTKRDSSLLIMFLLLSLLLVGITLYEYYYRENQSILGFLFFSFTFLALFFLIILKTTYFVLTDDELICHHLFFRKTIHFSSIRKVEKHKGLYAGLKMSTAGKEALIIHYNKFDEILISPEDDDKFIVAINKRMTQTRSSIQS